MTTTVPRTSLWPALVGALRGTVLELGPGSGANLRYYDASVRWLAVEPNTRAGDRSRAAAERLAPAGFDVVDLHRIDLPGPFGARLPNLVGAAARVRKGHQS